MTQYHYEIEGVAKKVHAVISNTEHKGMLVLVSNGSYKDYSFANILNDMY